MIQLTSAVEAAEARKRAAASLPDDAGGMVFANEAQDRALFSGFDVDYPELEEVATAFGRMMCGYTANVPLLALFTSAWTEGLLIGLLAARLRDQAERKDSDAPVG